MVIPHIGPALAAQVAAVKRSKSPERQMARATALLGQLKRVRQWANDAPRGAESEAEVVRGLISELDEIAAGRRE
jgi:hypothetical protein